MLLVNAKHPYRDNQTEGLIPVDMRFPGILLKREAANILRLIFEKIAADNSIVPVSGYRSAEEQKEIYADSVRDNGMEFTRKYVALPNHSEHQTGLAIDLGLNKKDIDFIRPDFPDYGVCGEFGRIAPDYGFILRYAKDKEKITGISHEPWHFRYVGCPHSKIIAQHGFSLEEYVEFIKKYREACPLVCRIFNDTEAEIYYVPVDGKTVITVPKDCICRISGNNADGFIITVWRK